MYIVKLVHIDCSIYRLFLIFEQVNIEFV